MLVDYTHGRLWLRCKAYTLCYNRASVCENTFLITVNITLTFFLRVKEQVKFRIFILEVKLEHFLAVVYFFTLRILDSQCIVQCILYIIRIIGRICIFFIKNLLDCRILCCINAQTTAVDKVLCLCSGISLNIHQVIDHLIDQFILKITVNRILCLRILDLGSLDA